MTEPIKPSLLRFPAPEQKHDHIINFLNERLMANAEDGAEACVLTFTAEKDLAVEIWKEYAAAGFDVKLDPSLSPVRWSLYFKLQETAQ